MISHIAILSGFHHSGDLIRSVVTVQYCFRHRPYLYDQSHQCSIWFSSQMTLGLIGHDNSININHTYRICHVVILFGFHHSLNLVRSVTMAQCRFQCRLHHYDQSHSCSIWFSLQSAPDLVSHDSLVLLLAQTEPV